VVIAVTVALFAGTALRFGADWAVPGYLVFFICLVFKTSLIGSNKNLWRSIRPLNDKKTNV
jgi:hypothetical protein